MLRNGVTKRVVVDVGVFEGDDVTIPAAQAGHRVYAFEPTARKHGKIRANIGAAPGVLTVRSPSLAECAAAGACAPFPPGLEKITLVAAACGATTGMAELAESPDPATGQRDETGYFGALDALVSNASRGAAKFVARVPRVRLDEVIDEDVYILKVSAQGFDGAVLRGAEGLFARKRVTFVTFEFWPTEMGRAGVGAAETLAYLGTHGFVCFDVTDDTKGGAPLNIIDTRPYTPQGFVDVFPALEHVAFGSGAFTSLLCAHERFFTDPQGAK